MGSFTQSVLNVKNSKSVVPVFEKEYTMPASVGSSATLVESVNIGKYDSSKYLLMFESKNLQERSGSNGWYYGSSGALYYPPSTNTNATLAGKTTYVTSGSLSPTSTGSLYGLYLGSYNPDTGSANIQIRSNASYAPAASMQGYKMKISVYLVPRMI